MKNLVLHIIIFISLVQITCAQGEDGVVALNIPARNSLMFNRFIANPTFSFVREQTKYITVTNKRELLGVEDAPLTYFFNYAGRIKENIGAGIGVYQQNYGVLTTFGGIANFAYNIQAQEDSNITFGINVGVYKSGLDNGRVVTNFDDTALTNIPSNFLLTVNPGINYGTGFMDFGVSLNNIVTYNFNASSLVEDNPMQGVQGHIMYTGYFAGGYGFFGDSRFSALARSEFQKDATILSGVVMLTVPKGIWAQVGYNSMYGASGGLGVNLTPQIAVEYNYERPITGFTNLGAAHEITLAYRFKNQKYYKYSRDDELAGIFTSNKRRKKKRKAIAKAPQKSAVENNSTVEADEDTAIAAEEKARQEAEENARILAEEEARIAAEEKARLAAQEQARIAAEEKNRQETEERARLASQEEARLKAEAEAKILAEENARLAAQEQARIAAEEKAKRLEEEARIAAEEEVRQQQDNEEEINDEIQNPTDEIGKSLSQLASQTETSRTEQTNLMEQLQTAVAIKEKDLKDLKEENDLSEQNIFVAPKPFKSVTEENKAIEEILINLDEVLIRRAKRISELESLLQDRIASVNNPSDETNLYYRNAIATLKSEQDKVRRDKALLVSSLEQISIDTDFERKRRIKRAAYNNDQDRYAQDRSMLRSLKQTVTKSDTPLTSDDFDFGKERASNIEILKNINDAEEGYYLILAVHNNIDKRDQFLVQVLSSGYKDVDFFFDVNTSEYYIYSQKFNTINEAEFALRNQEEAAYNINTTIIKIEK